MLKRVVCSFALVAAVAAASTASAGKFNKVLSVGDPAPNWSDLPGVDDAKHSLEDCKDAKAVVVVFTCNKCPVAVAYEDRLIELQKNYADKGVKVVAINCNNNDADGMAKMKERAESKGFNFDYVYDESQQSGRDYGATKTPEVFLLDKDGKIAYMGAIDDKPMDPTAVQTTYLSDAIDAVLAGEAPAVTEMKAAGCGIQYE